MSIGFAKPPRQNRKPDLATRLLLGSKYTSRVQAAAKAYLESHRDELRIVDVGLAAFVCVISIEALPHTAVLHRSDMLADETVGTLVDEAMRLVVGYLQVGAFRAVPLDRRTQESC